MRRAGQAGFQVEGRFGRLAGSRLRAFSSALARVSFLAAAFNSMSVFAASSSASTSCSPTRMGS